MAETQNALNTDEAAAELKRARSTLEGVVEKIAHGQTSERDLEVAERRVRFCEVRLETVRYHEERLAEEGRLKTLEDLAERTRERVNAAGVNKAHRSAVRALERYVAACMEHNEAIDEAVGELVGAQDLSQGFAVDMGRDGHSVVLGSESVRRIRPMVEVRDMALEVLGRHWRGGYISLGDDAY